MPITYRRPGVYLNESLLVNPGGAGSATTVAAFVGVAAKGPSDTPVLCESWSDYVTYFGGFDLVADPDNAGVKVLTYLPYSVYSFFQNGGRQAWVIRSLGAASAGTASSATVNGADAGATLLTAFVLEAKSPGVWGDDLEYTLDTKKTVDIDGVDQDGFSIQVLWNGEVVETFSDLSMTGDVPGTRRVDSTLNDPVAGSRYVTVTGMNAIEQKQPVATTDPVALTGGVAQGVPSSADMATSAELIESLDGPVTLNIVGYLDDATAEGQVGAAGAWQSTSISSSVFTSRSDIFIINDNCPPRIPGQTPSQYKTVMEGAGALATSSDDSYVASYGPWIKIPHPTRTGYVIDVPPGGAVAGMMARIDATIGVFRAPAGVIAGLSNAVGVQTKFTDTELGDLNDKNLNIIRPVVGAGICAMGGRTRKDLGVDQYISARRTLIYIHELLRRSTQFAVFENNDQRLWSALRMSGERILRPLWEAGGLKGANSAEAYFITCDESNNPLVSIAAGEVHMEVGVALQYPAEFVVIRITQFDTGTFTSEIQPTF